MPKCSFRNYDLAVGKWERVKAASRSVLRFRLSERALVLLLRLFPRDFSAADVPEGHVICSVPRVP